MQQKTRRTCKIETSQYKNVESQSNKKETPWNRISKQQQVDTELHQTIGGFFH